MWVISNSNLTKTFNFFSFFRNWLFFSFVVNNLSTIFEQWKTIKTRFDGTSAVKIIPSVSVPFVIEFSATSWATMWIISRSLLRQKSVLRILMRMSELRKRESLWSILLLVIVMVSISKPHIFLSLTEIWISDIIIIVGSNFAICFFSFFCERRLSKLCLFLCIKFSFNFLIFFFLFINNFFLLSLLSGNNRCGNNRLGDNSLGNWSFNVFNFLLFRFNNILFSIYIFCFFIVSIYLFSFFLLLSHNSLQFLLVWFIFIFLLLNLLLQLGNGFLLAFLFLSNLFLWLLFNVFSLSSWLKITKIISLI